VVFSLGSVLFGYVTLAAAQQRGNGGMGSFVGTPQGPKIVGTGNGTPEVPELPSAWGYSWATLSPGVINTER
jgi:hypothetical protein